MIKIKQYDTRPLDRTLMRGNEVLDLTDAEVVEFFFRLQTDGDLLGGECLVLDEPIEGMVRYEWSDTETDTAGLYYAEWVVTYAGGEVERVPGVAWEALRIEAALA